MGRFRTGGIHHLDLSGIARIFPQPVADERMPSAAIAHERS
jgi:hypothetical protein